VCSDARRTVEYYRDGLGFSLVKKTVNFDDPHSYHLYFGDESGSPGSLLTFFEWPRSEPGRLGRGTFDSIGVMTPAVSRETEVEDPDGLRLRLVPGERVRLEDVVAYGFPDLYAGLVDEGAPLRFAPAAEEIALMGPGITHHVAWRARGDEEQAAWSRRLAELGLQPTPPQERKYFRSIYFRMPDNLLFEIATDGPGFMVDELPAQLGQSLALPPWLEPERATLERELAPIT
jgi:glyoxalase family protein